MHFLSEYGLFLVKVLTIVIALLIIVGGITFIGSRAKNKEKAGKLTILKVNEKFQNYQNLINEETQSKAALKISRKKLKQQKKLASEQPRKRLFLLNFNGDLKASGLASLREEINAILLSKQPDDEVLIILESPGGLVHAYGLAAAQIKRLKDEKIKITAAVDKIAASGGYLMACCADHLIAAPFAIIGSIGVIAQLPNFHRWLEKNDIDFEQITAGQFKRTLTLFGKNTEEGRHKLQEEINDAHYLFKTFIEQFRPQVDLAQVATGEHWFGMRAVDLKLVDEIKTSDSFLLAAAEHSDIYQLKFEFKKSLGQRLNSTASMLLGMLFGRL